MRYAGRSLRALGVLFVAVSLSWTAVQAESAASASGTVRTYYIAADEIEWDYAPMNMDMMTGKPFEGYSKLFVEQGPQRIGQKYKKAVFREYTDDTFQTLKPRPAELAHMGILGPVIRAEVGDTIKIVFRNNSSNAFSIHPHGVSYAADSEGAMYADAIEHPAAHGLVAPGKTHIYTWTAREQCGPGPQDGSSVVWLYHSHNYEPKDVNAGLIGPIVITRKGMARPDGSPKDVDREFFALFMLFDENQSHYLKENIKKYAGEPDKVNRLDFVPGDLDGNSDLVGHGFGPANVKSTINGYMFGNGPKMVMYKGERVRWYVMTMGEGFNIHTPHWHGNVLEVRGKRLDVFTIGPAEFVTADMVPDMAGSWMFHCHVDEHMMTGMMTEYQVLEKKAGNDEGHAHDQGAMAANH
jgi:FtsP/CotA-like multicopper oxidase with cupredoxin domain